MGENVNKNGKEQWDMESNIERRGGEEEEEGLEMMKRRISCHPLFDILVKAHLECLKVNLGETGEVVTSTIGQADTCRPNRTDIDDFMEGYCMALSELKEAMKESVQETAAFINSMHFQLRQLMAMNLSTHYITPNSSGEVLKVEETSMEYYLHRQQDIKGESVMLQVHHGLSSCDDAGTYVMVESKAGLVEKERTDQ